MDSALTRAQFALQALVAAGHVTQAKVDEALALFPAPAGEPEMPEIVGYLLTGSRAFVDDVERTESAAFRRRTARNDGTAVEPLVRLSAVRAYGDARAEHARRVAMEDAAKLCDKLSARALGAQVWPADALSNVMLRQVAHLGHDECAEAIRAAAPPQGEAHAPG